MQSFYKNKKVLITGHTGFKGAWLTQILLTFGADVVGVSLEPNTTPNLFDILDIEKNISHHICDIRDAEKLTTIFKKEKPEIVFHLAAQALVKTSYQDPIGTISTNVLGTANVLQAIKDVGTVKSAVIITTDKVYENKEAGNAFKEEDSLGGYDPYSGSKAAADIITTSYVRSFFNPHDFGSTHHTLIATARAGNVIGGGDWSEFRLIPDAMKSLYEHENGMEIRSPKSIRPWQHVLEPLYGYLLLGQKLYMGDSTFATAFNFGPEHTSFVQVDGVLRELSTHAKDFIYNIKPDSMGHEAGILKLDITKAKDLLNWNPSLTFKETIHTTFHWYKKYYEKDEDIIAFTNKQINSFFDTL